MSIDLAPLASARRLLFAVPLRPAQGHRFQPTGFPDLGAAVYQAPVGDAEAVSCLLVESPQSMANRLEAVCWDSGTNDLVPALAGLSYVRVQEGDAYLTSSITEAHRLNSHYIEMGDGGALHSRLRTDLGLPLKGRKGKSQNTDSPNQEQAGSDNLIDRVKLATVLFRLDVGSLIHGVFLESIDGRLRVPRALSAFVEAESVAVAASGGVKLDHIRPGKDTGADASSGTGNVLFHREEYTARKITAYFSLDLAQIRGYRLGADAERLLQLLGLFKIRALLDGDLRFRTACDFVVADQTISSDAPLGFVLPALADIERDLSAAISRCADQLAGATTVQFTR